MSVWVLKGSLYEQRARVEAVSGLNDHIILWPAGLNTWEEAQNIAQETNHGQTVHVVTSNYHVARAYLTLCRAFSGQPVVVHVEGVGRVTEHDARREAAKLAEAQAKGHACRWEDAP